MTRSTTSGRTLVPVDERRTRIEPLTTPTAVGALGELIETERAIEAQLALARDEARRILEEAREGVRAEEERFDTVLDEALSQRRATLEDACGASCRALEADAAAEAKRYREVDAETVDDLARWVAARVAGNEAST